MKKMMRIGLLCLLSSFLAGCAVDFQNSNPSNATAQSTSSNPLNPTESTSQPINPPSSTPPSGESDVPSSPLRKITFSLDPYGGSVSPTSVTLDYGQPFTLPIPVKLGYVFEGWYHAGTKVTDSSGQSLGPLNIAKDGMFMANYKVRNITLNFYLVDQKLASRAYNIEMNLDSVLEGDITALTDPLWGWYKDKETTQFVNSYEDLVIDENNNANIYAKKAEGIKYDGTTLLEADKSIVFGDVDLNRLFIGGRKITKIGIAAFLNNQGLTSIIIPDSVTEISSSVFNQCSNLKSARLPKGLLEIDTSVFGNCSSLSSIEIPDSVENIGLTAFENCISLKNIKMPKNLLKIGMTAFYGCPFSSIELPENVKEIGSSAFSNCANLTSITIPDGVTEIPLNTFYGCKSLQTVILPQNLAVIQTQAFYKCESLTAITIPSTVTKVRGWAFKDCLKLKIHVDLPRPADGKTPEGWDRNWNEDNLPVTWRGETPANSSSFE